MTEQEVHLRMGESIETAGQDLEQVACSCSGECAQSSNLAINLATAWVWPRGGGACRQRDGAPVTV